MTFHVQEAHFEHDTASEQVEALFERLRESPRADEHRVDPVTVTPDLIQRLARELSRAHGEDPDEQPFPLRAPRWRYHCARAKTLLAITAAERQALASVLGG